MKTVYLIMIGCALLGCKKQSNGLEDKTGSYSGIFEHGDFSTPIQFEVEQDSSGWNVFFTSLEQNANRIPLQNIEIDKDSIHFVLQSDFYTYSFRNKWNEDRTQLEGVLAVDSVETGYVLERKLGYFPDGIKSKEVQFEANGLNLKGTIWYSEKNDKKGMVLVSSSGNADRSASRAEAILLAQKGYTIFHYDKRGTGASEGEWGSASMEELLSDDMRAIRYFSSEMNLPLSAIGIKGSSQGGAKIPFILNAIKELKYGIIVSCPGTTLLESDLNYWKNRNARLIGADINSASEIQRKVFEYIAGTISRGELEHIIASSQSEQWFEHIWVPDLNDVERDTKLLYNPIPHFEKVEQPVLVIQGTLDEIIPSNSYDVIAKSLVKANNKFEIELLEGASHSMYNVGKSDFMYWSKLHPEYLKVLDRWLATID